MDETYWAAKPTTEFADELVAQLDEAKEAYGASPQAAAVQEAYVHYYGGIGGDGGQALYVQRAGEQGELADFRLPHCRALAVSLQAIVTAAKVTWQTAAANRDHKTQARTILGAQVLEWWWKQNGGDVRHAELVEQAIVFGEAALFWYWDSAAGKEMPAPDMQLAYEGEVACELVHSWDLLRKPGSPSFEGSPWLAVRCSRNRYDLLAQHAKPEDSAKRDGILNATSRDEGALFSAVSDDESDWVPVFYFFHKRRPSLPLGRRTVLVGNTILEDGPLEVKAMPVVRLAAGNMSATAWPHTSFSGTLAVQECIDSIHSGLVTNITSTAGGLISAETASDLGVDSVAGGPKVMYRPKGSPPPEAINLSPASPDSFKYGGELVRHQEQLLGLNATARGVPEYANLSGAAMALLSAQAISNNSPLQGSHVRAVQESGRVVLQLYARHMGGERLVPLTGKDNRHLAQSLKFGPEDLGAVETVTVEVGNPLQQTVAGRMEVATLYKDMGFARTPEQMAALLETGRMDPLTNELRTGLLLIQWENEQLREGKPLPVTVYDDHSLHGRGHRELVNDPLVRENPAAMQALLTHIDEHALAQATTDPAKLALVGLAPMAPPGMPPPPGAPIPPEGGPPPEPGAELAPPPVGDTAPAAGMPINPATGQSYDNVTGGGAVPPLA